MIRLTVFLGNPGPQYERTRHNAGWLVAEAMPYPSRSDWRRKYRGEYAEVSVRGERRRFLKPLTFMNKSGSSVAEVTAFFRIEASEVLVVHDDIELDFGELGLKSGGGVAGHNGLRSIASAIGSRDFVRVQLGVGRPARGSVSSYVLSSFSRNEEQELPQFIETAARWTLGALENGFTGRVRERIV